MKWMEVIRLRIAEKNPKLVEQEIGKLIQELGHNGSIKDINLYHNAVLNNDLSLHLHWETDGIELQGSAIGLCLIHILKEFGLISHSVWLDEGCKTISNMAPLKRDINRQN